MTYKEFLERKIDIAPLSGIEIDPAEVSPALKDHQRVSVLWALRGGRRGIFARFGLGKTIMQLEWCRLYQQNEDMKKAIDQLVGLKVPLLSFRTRSRCALPA